MLPHVYDRPGRIVRLLGEDEGDEKNALIGVPFVPGPDGQPVPVPPGAMLPPGMPQPKTYDLSQGEYQVAVTVGRSFATQKEQNLDVMNSWVEASKGAAFPWVADIMAEQLDGNIAKRVAKRMKMMNPQLAQGEDEQEIPPQAQAMMAQAQQQMQQMQAAMQEMKAKLDADAVRAQADLARTKMEIESKERIAHMQRLMTEQVDLVLGTPVKKGIGFFFGGDLSTEGLYQHSTVTGNGGQLIAVRDLVYDLCAGAGLLSYTQASFCGSVVGALRKCGQVNK